MTRRLMAIGAVVVVMSAAVVAQSGRRPASPQGTAAAQVGGKYDTSGGEPVYKDGKWIEVTFSRPIRRGRDVFTGEGDKYAKVANPDAPVWRAGADNSTQLKTEVPLVINGKRIAPGTYTMFIDLKPNAWTLIVSTWKAQTRYDPNNKEELWGAYGYTPDKDVVRAPMKLERPLHVHEQLSWEFLDMTDQGGTLVVDRSGHRNGGSIERYCGRRKSGRPHEALVPPQPKRGNERAAGVYGQRPTKDRRAREEVRHRARDLAARRHGPGLGAPGDFPIRIEQ